MPVLALAKLVIKEIFRKKDFYVALVLMAAVLLYVSSLKVYNVENVVRYLQEAGLALIYLVSTLLAVPLAARQYPSEVQQRTLAVAMAKPVRRFEFILGKFLGACAAGVSCFLIFYALFALLAFSKDPQLSWPAVAQTAALFCFGLTVAAAMASAFSYYMTFSAAVSVTLVLYLLMNAYGAGLKQFGAGLGPAGGRAVTLVYYLLPHFEFFDLRQRLIHGWGPVPMWLVAALGGYALLYTALLLLLAWARFRRQAIR